MQLLTRLILIAGIAAACFFAGVQFESAKPAKVIIKEIAKERVKVKRVIEYREKLRIEYRDRLQTIKTSPDPTGCLNMPISDILPGILLPAGKD